MAKKEEATRVSLVPDTKAVLKGASLKKTDAKSKTTKPTKKNQSKTNFDRDTRDQEDMDITGSLLGNETEAEEDEPTHELADEETAGGLLIEDAPFNKRRPQGFLQRPRISWTTH